MQASKPVDRRALAEQHLWVAESLARRAAGRGRDYADIYGEACVALVRAANSWPGRGKASTYLWISVARAVNAAVRRAARSGGVELVPDLDDVPEADRAPRGDQFHRLAEMVRRLPHPHGELVRLTLGAGATPPDAWLAKRVGVRKSEVKKIKSQAVAMLRVMASSIPST